MQQISIIGAKGGVGATTVACALALDLARTADAVPGEIGIVGYHRDDIAATFGCYTKNADRLSADIEYGNGTMITVCDYGPGSIDMLERESGPAYLVTRACYLALRRSAHDPKKMSMIDGVILIEEPGRALSRREVADVLGKPLVATIPFDPSIARMNDAGVMAVRMPGILQKPIHALVADSGLLKVKADR